MLGEFKPMTTVQLADELRQAGAAGRSPRSRSSRACCALGKTLSYGDVDFKHADDGKLAAHATTTYALL